MSDPNENVKRQLTDNYVQCVGADAGRAMLAHMRANHIGPEHWHRAKQAAIGAFDEQAAQGFATTSRVDRVIGQLAVFEPSDDGGYTVTVPSLPGCISEGSTLDEARTNIAEAIELWLESDSEGSM